MNNYYKIKNIIIKEFIEDCELILKLGKFTDPKIRKRFTKEKNELKTVIKFLKNQVTSDQ